VSYVLDELAPCITDDGAIILDDYFAWDGCARATHDYLSRNSLAWRIRSMDKFYGAWMIKRDYRISEL
jgi:O-methyltransferase